MPVRITLNCTDITALLPDILARRKSAEQCCRELSAATALFPLSLGLPPRMPFHGRSSHATSVYMQDQAESNARLATMILSHHLRPLSFAWEPAGHRSARFRLHLRDGPSASTGSMIADADRAVLDDRFLILARSILDFIRDQCPFPPACASDITLLASRHFSGGTRISSSDFL